MRPIARHVFLFPALGALSGCDPIHLQPLARSARKRRFELNAQNDSIAKTPRSRAGYGLDFHSPLFTMPIPGFVITTAMIYERPS
jgi:hypothetical protein